MSQHQPPEQKETSAEYYLSASTVLSSKSVFESDSVMTEAEAIKDFSERGFGDCTLLVSYDMEGNFLVEEEIDGSETEKHPYYECVYIDDNAETWIIRSYDGYMMASPVSYSAEANGPEIIYAEDDYVVSYDSNSGTFYRIIPNAAELSISNIGRIDADSLAAVVNGGVSS